MRALFLATVSAAVLSASIAGAATLPATPATFSAVVAKARAGDIVQLAAGVYSGLSFYGQNFGAGITLTSADPAHPAVLTNFNIEAVQGLTFSRLDFKVLLPNYNAFNVYSSQRIAYDQVHVYGPAGPPDPDVQALNIFDSAFISFTNSEIERVSHGLSIARSDDITVAGNNIHHVNSDSLDFVQVGRATVTGNALHDFFPTEGNHPDAMQFGTANSTKPSHDVTIADNLIWRGAGQDSQGIFISDELGNMAFVNFTVARNLVVGTGSSALRPTHSAGIVITGNELVSYIGANPTNLLVQNSDQVSVSGNAAASLSVTAANGNSNISLGANTTNAPITPAQGDARALAWFAAHPAVPGGPVPPPPPAPDPRDAQIAALQAQVAQDATALAQVQAAAQAAQATLAQRLAALTAGLQALAAQAAAKP